MAELIVGPQTMADLTISSSQDKPHPRRWLNGWWTLLLLLLAAPWLQLPWVVCACYKGEIKAMALIGADVAIAIRTFVGLFRREQDLTWFVYVLLYVGLVPLTKWIAD